MIDGYKCRDGKVIVVNYDNYNNVNEEEREYQDNIDELLKAENMEEYLDNLRDKFKKDIEGNENCIGHYNVKISDGKMLIFMWTFGGASACLFYPWIPLIVCFFGSVIYFNLKTIIPSKKKIKECQKEIKATEFILEGIKEEQQKNQRDLRRLRNDNKVENEYIDSNYRQFDLKELKDVNNYLELWGYVGKNEDDLLWYDEQGCMYRKLEGEFTPDEIKTLRRILKRNDKRY